MLICILLLTVVLSIQHLFYSVYALNTRNAKMYIEVRSVDNVWFQICWYINMMIY